MKSFLWRMRSSVGLFIAAISLFTVIYLIVAYTNVRSFGDSDLVRCLDGIDPTIVCCIVSFAFFLVCSKRYTYEEAYLYGQSRKGAFCSALCAATAYSVLFACYALGLALFVRRSVLSMPDLVVSSDIYRLSATDILCNLSFIFTVNLIAYEGANILRKFKSWKFWVSVIVCIAAFVLLYVFIVVIPQSKGMLNFEYWKAMFSVFVPLFIVAVICDFLMARGRVCR